MTPGQIRKNWLTSARAWCRAAQTYTSKRDRQFAERECWNALFKAITGL
jgi:hypothetical protein